MKEDIRSMKFYFLAVGLGTSVVYGMMFQGDVAGGPLSAFPFIGVGLGIAYLVLGAKLPELLAKQPGLVYAVLCANFVFSIALGIVGSVYGRAESAQTVGITGVAIAAYFFFNAKRLAAELASSPPDP